MPRGTSTRRGSRLRPSRAWRGSASRDRAGGARPAGGPRSLGGERGLPLRPARDRAGRVGPPAAGATGVGWVLETARVWPGARVAVIGCGAVGISVVQGARIAGAAEIHAIDPDERKLEAAKRFGATHTGEPDQVDFAFDVVGQPETLELAVRVLGHAGTAVLVGLPRPETFAWVELAPFFDKRSRVLVSHG